MTTLQSRLSSLSSAEDFLNFFSVTFDEDVVRVHRLHILKRFHQYLNSPANAQSLDDPDAHERCRSLLQRAHDDFAVSTAAREKVFKVFQDAAGQRRISLESVRASLPSRVAHAAPDVRSTPEGA